jgi:hypothetical protein
MRQNLKKKCATIIQNIKLMGEKGNFSSIVSKSLLLAVPETQQEK